jgi:SMC interacting uncharacterized protein involved in chromosome segregation
MFKTKSSVNQMKNKLESFTNRLYRAKERITSINEKVEELLYSDSNKEKIRMTINFKKSHT